MLSCFKFTIFVTIIFAKATAIASSQQELDCLYSVFNRINSPLFVSFVYLKPPIFNITASHAEQKLTNVLKFETLIINDKDQLKFDPNGNYRQIILNFGMQNNTRIQADSILIDLNTNSKPELSFTNILNHVSQIHTCENESKRWHKTTCIKNICKTEEFNKNLQFGQPKDFLGARLTIVKPKPTKATSTKLHLEIDAKKLEIFNTVLNFTPVIIFPSNTSGGGNSWEDVSSLVRSKKADIITSPTVMLSKKTNEFRFLIVNRLNGLRAYFQPERDARVQDITMAGFCLSIWAGIFGQLVAMAICLKIILKFEKMESFVATIGFFALQGIYKKHMYRRKFVSTRILCLTANMSAFIIYTVFSASLVSKLSNIAVSIQTLEELITHNYNFGFKNNDSYLYDTYLTGNARNSTIGRIIQGTKFEYFFETAQSRSAIRNDPKLVIISERNLYKGSSNLSSKFRDILIDDGGKVKLGGIVLRGSSLSDPFNYALIKKWETGLRKRLLTFEEKEEDLNAPDRTTEANARSIRLEDIYVPFVVLLAGVLLSLFCGVAEKFYEQKVKI